MSYYLLFPTQSPLNEVIARENREPRVLTQFSEYFLNDPMIPQF